MEELDYDRIERLIEDNGTDEAQTLLDGVNVRGADWHYLQCKIFVHKNWLNEARKQIEIALELEPDNAQYKEELEKLKELGAEPPKSENWDLPQMEKGSCKDGCRESSCECCAYCGAECCCQLLCEAICNGCG